jgi:hypothetical protein
MQFHERFLDQILGNRPFACQAQGVAEQRGFEGSKELFNRFGRLRARLFWLAGSHASVIFPASPAARRPVSVTGSRWSHEG